jgi:glycosyltransferase involved in cell wall biosynthesis
MKIAIVVHGRFHGFDLARALIKRGHEVTVFTNYPKRAARKFGLPDERIRSFWLHGVVSRVLHRVGRAIPRLCFDAFVHRMFGRWAAGRTSRETWDVIYAFSGVAEEILRRKPQAARQRWVVRGSAHIFTQDRLLAEEERRAGAAIERPSQWMLRREQREYQLADRIVTLSSFSRNTFLEHGLPPEKVLLIPSGVDFDAFRPTGEIVTARWRRIRRREPLRVLFTGTVSLQKGIFDLVEVIERADPRHFQFRFVSNVTPDAAALLERVAGRIELGGRLAERELPRRYEEADLFVFPTIQDGFAAVLAQAHANALPIIATTNCAAPDLIEEGKTGWVVPIRQPAAIVERLRWCHEHREELAAMVERIYHEFRPRTWDDMAADFERHLAAEAEAR